jgi:hypothetical protein
MSAATYFPTENRLGGNFYSYLLPSTATDQPTVGQGKVGDIVEGTNGAVWIRLLNSSTALVAGEVVNWTTAFVASGVTTSNSAFGQQVGVCPIAVPANAYFWAQIKGLAAAILVSASTPANTQLITTTTAGQLVNGTTTGTKNVNGIVLTAAQGSGGAGTQPGWLTNPVIGTTN